MIKRTQCLNWSANKIADQLRKIANQLRHVLQTSCDITLLLGRRKAEGVRAALAAEPLADIGPRRRPGRIPALWPLEEGAGAQAEERYDRRDWSNNIHRGAQRHAVGLLEVTE